MGIFGSITRALFGGSKSKNESGNLYADDLKNTFLPGAQNFGAGMGQAAGILGLNGGAAQDEALGNWYDSSGGKFLLGQGLDQVDAMYRSRGLGQSGAAMKAMEDYRTGLASTKLNEYMGNLSNLNQQALGAGGLVANAGQYSKGKNTSSGGGLGTFLGALLSDPRVKTNVVRIGKYPDGLGIYEFDYIPLDGALADYAPEGRQVGVMADEVAQLRPWALGPEIEGFRTVDYGALELTQ
jgi:hypothetical protein